MPESPSEKGDRSGKGEQWAEEDASASEVMIGTGMEGWTHQVRRYESVREG